MWKNNRSFRGKFSPWSGMRGRLIAAFALFALLAIGVLWLIQTVCMDWMYSMVKHQELYRCAHKLEDVLESETLEDTVLDLANEYSVCVSVYRIRDGHGSVLAEQHTNMLCTIHNTTSVDMLNRLYLAANGAKNGYTEEISIGELFFQNPPEDMPDRGGDDVLERTRSVLHAKLISYGDTTYMLLLNTELVPLTSTVSTLQLQMIFLSLVLAILAVLLGVIVASRFTKPLTQMCDEANKLSMGNYNVNFDGGNCRETAQLSAALNRAAYELSQLDKMQKDLIANISHDLRTPLTMISGYSEVIRDLPGEATPENMQVIIDESHRLTTLVNDMLEISRYQNGSQVLHYSCFNFTDTLRQTLYRYAKLLEKENYTIHLEASCDLWVEADETRILQVLYNLIGNAVNYTGEDKTIIVRQEALEEEVLISVIDSGDGIPPEQLPLVWERYYKVHDFHRRANIGTGLGLSIVKNILVLHGTRFGVQSTVGEGSTFWFTLPYAKQDNLERT